MIIEGIYLHNYLEITKFYQKKKNPRIIENFRENYLFTFYVCNSSSDVRSRLQKKIFNFF